MRRDGELPTGLDEDQWEDLLKELMPPSLSQLFFFDGEKVQELATAIEDDDSFENSLFSLPGLELVDRLDTDLSIYVSRKLDESGVEGITDELNEPRPPNLEEYNSDGQMFNRYTLLGEHDALYMALLKEWMLQEGKDPEEDLYDEFVAHLNRGVAWCSATLATSPTSTTSFRTSSRGYRGRRSTMSTRTEGAIYLDHHATTPVNERVVEEIQPYFTSQFGNPASDDHIRGRSKARC